MMRWARIALLTILVLGTVAACGGDDGDDTAATATATEEASGSAPSETAAATEEADETAAETEEATETEAPATATMTEEATETAAKTEAEAATSPVAGEEGTEVAEVTPQLPVTVTDVNGIEVTVSDVSKIIPLNGDIAEIVYVLGLGGNVVATDTSATYPPEAEAAPKIGYQRTLAAEGILALSPTVVIGDETAGPPEVLEQIASAGVAVVILPEIKDVDRVPEKIQMVADALGVSDKGAEIAAKAHTDIEAAEALVEGVESQPRAMFLYVRGAQTQMIGGAGTTADGMLVAAGAINAGAEAGINGFQPITAEAIVAAQPDVFVLLTAGLESVGGVEGLMEIPGVAQTPAGQNGKVVDFDDGYFLGYGPRTGQALVDLIHAMHPEIGDGS